MDGWDCCTTCSMGVAPLATPAEVVDTSGWVDATGLIPPPVDPLVAAEEGFGSDLPESGDLPQAAATSRVTPSPTVNAF
jgi:hypothetical protein